MYQHLSKFYMNIASSPKSKEVFYNHSMLLFIILQALTPLISYMDHNKELQLTLQILTN